MVCARLNQGDFKAFQAAMGVLGYSRAAIVREAVLAWLAARPELGSREEFHSAPVGGLHEPPAQGAPALPRTKAVHQGDGRAIRPREGMLMGGRRQEGALLGPEPQPKSPSPDRK